MHFTASTGRIPECRRHAVGLARDAGASEHALRVVALLTTEAVTNAIHHGPAAGTVSLDVTCDDGCVHVAVGDASAAPPVLRRVEPAAGGGRGVMLVDTLASAWGVDLGDDGTKVVWFEVPLDAAGWPDL